MRVVDALSPNHGPRRGGARPRLVVLHYTAMARAEDALARLRDPAAEVSAHWLIGEDGTVWRLVEEARRAWHAGAGAWGGARDVNSASIGVELANPGDAPFAAAQTAALRALLRGALARWAIPPQGVIGHACLAPGRKRDPGRRFDWRGLAAAGLAVWADPPPPGGGAPDAAAFQAAAAAFGHPVPRTGVWDAATQAVAQAHLDRFAPGRRLDGALTAHLSAMAARWPAA